MKILALTLLTLATTCSAFSEEDWTNLFKDASHEDFYFTFIEDTKPEDVFKFTDDGTLLVEGKGKPIGFIQTLDEYTSYEIQTDWRWPNEAGNGGIQLHCASYPHTSIWPESIEVRLTHKHTGDFWLRGMTIEVEQAQMPKKAAERNKRYRLLDKEKKPGEWNELQILVTKKEIAVSLNGKRVNKGINPSSTSGYITIKSEDSDIEFRNFKIRKLNEEYP